LECVLIYVGTKVCMEAGENVTMLENKVQVLAPPCPIGK